jgi:hypothetical protein
VLHDELGVAECDTRQTFCEIVKIHFVSQSTISFYLQSRRRVRLFSVVISIPWEFSALNVVPQSHHTPILKRSRVEFDGITTIIENQWSHPVVVFGSLTLKECSSTEIGEKVKRRLERTSIDMISTQTTIHVSKKLLTEHNGFLVRLAVALEQLS